MDDAVTKVINSLTPKISNEDHLKVVARIRTFRIPDWFMKPPEINPLECSKNGWQLLGTDQLECTSCKTVACPTNANELKSLHTSKCYYRLFQDDLLPNNLEDPWLKTDYGYECQECFMRVSSEFDPIIDHRTWCPRRVSAI